VAVIDTGCDPFHPDLKDSIWTNPGESGTDSYGRDKATNGVDDDGNGFVDDVHGWNFVSDSPEIMDEHGHGTHIAGIINNPHVSLMILKYFDNGSSGPENMANSIQALNYAIKMGAKIINYSGGGVLKSALEEEALREASRRGVLVVAAAGNEGLNSDFFHFYPADYDLPNIVSVAAVDRSGELLPSSNFGRKTVDVAALGKNVYSTLPNGEYGFMTGTSQATAFATRQASLWAHAQLFDPSPEEIRAHLLSEGKPSAKLHGKMATDRSLSPESDSRRLVGLEN
jgi:subtilisin family serine protease